MTYNDCKQEEMPRALPCYLAGNPQERKKCQLRQSLWPPTQTCMVPVSAWALCESRCHFSGESAASIEGQVVKPQGLFSPRLFLGFIWLQSERLQITIHCSTKSQEQATHRKCDMGISFEKHGARKGKNQVLAEQPSHYKWIHKQGRSLICSLSVPGPKKLKAWNVLASRPNDQAKGSIVPLTVTLIL